MINKRLLLQVLIGSILILILGEEQEHLVKLGAGNIWSHLEERGAESLTFIDYQQINKLSKVIVFSL